MAYIKKILCYLLVLLFFLGLIPVGTFGLVVTPDISYVVGNETYSVTHNMTFSSIVITGSDYITFNNTDFRVDSGNSIYINLSYLHSNIGSAGDGVEVLDMVVNCSSGLVYFNLSGFKTNTPYNISRNGTSIATPTSDGSGILRFTNSVWSHKHFEITESSNIGVPVVTTNASTEVEETSAILHGYLVDDGNETCTAWFEYGINTSYGTNTSNCSVNSGDQIYNGTNRYEYNPYTGAWAVGGIYTKYYRAQSFYIGGNGVNEDFFIENISLILKRNGDPSNPLTVSVKATSGGEPVGDSLVSGTISSSSLSTSFAWYNITMDTQFKVSSSTTYAIVINTTGGNSGSQYQIGLFTDQYSWGTAYYSDDYGGAWSDYNNDCGFKVFGYSPSNITGLSPGQLYRYRAVANNSNGIGYGSAGALLTKPLYPTSMQTVGGVGNINISWTKGTGANFTYVERNTSSSWERGDGTLIYNGSALYYVDTGLSSDTTYYYQIWSFTNWTYNPTVHQFSDSNSSSSNTTVGVDPPYNVSVNYDVAINNLSFSWTRGNYSDQEVVVKKADGFPTSPSDGTVMQNNTNTSYNETISSYAYFTVWSYNSTYNVYSDIGLDINWGNLGLNCFNESNPSQAIGFDIEITNSDASIVYTATDLSNTHWIDLNEIPFGDNTIFIVTNSSYKLRTYYKDLEANHFYNYSFYLPPIETDSGGGDDTGTGTLRTYTDVKPVTNPNADVTVTLTHTMEEMISVDVYNISGTYPSWVSVPNDNYTVSGDDVIINQSVLNSNTTMVKVTYYYLDYDNMIDTQLYILNVVGPQNEYTSPPVEGAKIIIKRYMNTSDSYEEIASLLTDANGNADVYLIPETFLKVFISKDGYDSTVSTYIPSASIPTKTFRINPSVTPPEEYDRFWDNITFTGTMYLNETIHVVYADSNSSTVNTSIYLYDVFNGSLVDTNIKSGNNDFSYWVSGINTSRDYELWLYFNNTANYAGVISPVVITVFGINKSWDDSITPIDLEGRFEGLFGDFPLGYENVIAIIIPIILLCIFGSFHIGLGILSAGISLGFIQVIFSVWVSNVFNPLLALMCPIIIALGFLYMFSVKGGEHL